MNNTLYGSLLGLIAILFSLISQMIIKDLTFEIDFLMAIFGRFVFSIPILLLFAILIRKKQFLKVNNWKNIFLRSFFGFITMIPVFWSLQLIPIALVTALAHSSAIFVTLFAPFFIGEKVGKIRWFAVILGLVGVYLITNPVAIWLGTINLSPIGLSLATFSAISHAGLAIILRKLGKTEHPSTTALIHNSITSFVIIITIILFGTKFIGVTGKNGVELLFNPNNLLYILILLGLIGSIVQYTMASSYKYADATILVTIRYLAIPLATLFGYLIWEEIPSISQVIGGLFIISSCLTITLREMKSQKKIIYQ